MSDPRNVAHDKKVKQEKEHDKPESDSAAPPRHAAESTSSEQVAKEAPESGDLEKSLAVLSKLKEMEFHSRGNIETLAGLILTIEDELKQKEFSEPIGALYGAQDGFHSKIATLIESYEAKCESLKPST